MSLQNLFSSVKLRAFGPTSASSDSTASTSGGTQNFHQQLGAYYSSYFQSRSSGASLKLVLLGDSRTLKTRFIETYGSEFHSQEQTVKTKINCADPWRYELQLTWVKDFSQLVLSEVNDAEHADFSLTGASACIICFSLTDRISWRHAREKWLPLAKRYCEGIPIVFVGTNAEERDQLARRLKLGKPKPSKASIGSTSKGAATEMVASPETFDEDLGRELHICDLPAEVLLRSFDFLKLKDLLSAMLVCKQWRMIATHDYVWMHRPEAYVKKDEGKFIARLLARTPLHFGSAPGPSAGGATLYNETGNAKSNGDAGSEGGGSGGGQQGQSIEYMECTVKNNKNVRRVVQKVTALARRGNAIDRKSVV